MDPSSNPAGGPRQSCAWVFTLNNPTATDVFSNWQRVPDAVFGIAQLETGESGTPHLQGYVVLAKKKTRSFVRRYFSDRAYWAPRKGTHAEAVHYASKPHGGCGCEHCEKAAKLPAPSKQETWGEAPKSVGQGHRSDLDTVKNAIDQGQSELEIAETFFGSWCRHHRAFSLYRMLKCKGRDPADDVMIICLYGPPGTGKTRLATKIAPDAYWLAAPNQYQGALWWDGYQGQPDLIIDEFYGWIPHPSMLRICDRNPLNVQVKSGHVHLMARRIIITSNKHPAEWWPRTPLGAMVRRLTYPVGNTVHLTAEPADYDAKAAELVDREQFSRELPALPEFVPNQHPAPAAPQGGMNGFEVYVPQQE